MNSIPHKSNRKIAFGLIVLFCIALFVRLIVLFLGPWKDTNRAIVPDSGRYLTLAENLQKYREFGKQQEDGIVHNKIFDLRASNGTLPPKDKNGLRPESFRTPGYPALIALIKTVGGDTKTVLFVQCLFGAFLSCMVVQIAKALGLSNGGAFWAGYIWAFHPGLILHDVLIITESFFNFCTAFALYCIAYIPNPLNVMTSGIMIGIATLVRPLGLFYLPSALFLNLKTTHLKIIASLFLISLALAPVFFWSLRNCKVGEGFRLSTVGEHNLLFYTAAYAISEEKGEDWFQSWSKRVAEFSEELKHRISEKQDVFKEINHLALEKMLSHPFIILKVFIKSTIKLMLDHSLGEAANVLGLSYQPSGLFSRLILRNKNAISIETDWFVIMIALAWVILNAAISLIALIGFFAAFFKRNWNLVLFCGMPIAFFILSTFSVGLERFRMPIMLPLLILMGSVFCVRSRIESENKSGRR